MKKILGICGIYLLFYLFVCSNSEAATQNKYHIYLYDNYFTYSGEEICPEIQKVTVDTEDGEETLTQDTDYIVRYQNNINAGEGTITVYGRGEYSGSESLNFTIHEKKLVHKNCKYDVIYSDFVPGEPTLQLYCDDILLYQNVDYGIEYKNNEKITDEAILVVSGEGNYIGELTIPYQIPAKDLSRYGIVGEVEDMEYTGQLLFQSLDVHYVVNGNSEKLALNTDYNTSFSGNQEVGVCTVTITGCGNYTGSIYKTFRILPRDIEECSADEILDSVYTTKEIRPKPVVTDGTKQLKYGSDYELSYQNHINAGEATVIVAGKGNYTGRLFVPFEILPKNIGRIKVENIVHKEYSGKEMVQKFLQVPGLVKNRDYTVSYENNVDIGKALVILSGQGNYTGEREIAFRIVKKKKASRKTVFYC